MWLDRKREMMCTPCKNRLNSKVTFVDSDTEGEYTIALIPPWNVSKGDTIHLPAIPEGTGTECVVNKVTYSLTDRGDSNQVIEYSRL